MTFTLDLPPDLEARVNAEASRQGRTPSEYLMELVRSAIPEEPPVEDDLLTSEEIKQLMFGPWPEDEPRPTNGAELVAYWKRHGLLGTRPDIKERLKPARQR